jgi:hypothetical protein
MRCAENRTPDHEVRLIRPDGGGAEVIATCGDDGRFAGAAWSTDGRHLVFVRTHRDQRHRVDAGSIESYDRTTRQTAVVIAGAGIRNCLFARRPHIVCEVSWDSRIRLRSAIVGIGIDERSGMPSENPRLITEWPEPTAALTTSASGARIALRSNVVQHSLYVFDLPLNGRRAANPRQLTFGTGRDDYPHSWSADGQVLFFDSNRHGKREIFRQPQAGVSDERAGAGFA